MSLILDALKKSEAERQRGQVPNLLSPQPITPSYTLTQRKSVWPLILILAVLLLASLVLVYFYTKSRAASAPGNATATLIQTPAQSSPAKPATMVATPPPQVKPVPPTSSPRQNPSAAVLEISQPPAVKPPIAAEVIPAPIPAPVLETAAGSRIASLAEMPSEQRQQLPSLKLSMHVFSAEPGKRFAIVDGQRVNEGSVLGTAVVEQIRQDGVVLSVQGQSYFLPRP